MEGSISCDGDDWPPQTSQGNLQPPQSSRGGIPLLGPFGIQSPTGQSYYPLSIPDNEMGGLTYNAGNQYCAGMPMSRPCAFPDPWFNCQPDSLVHQPAPNNVDTALAHESIPRLNLPGCPQGVVCEGLQENSIGQTAETAEASKGRTIKRLIQQLQSTFDASGYPASTQGKAADFLKGLNQLVDDELKYGNYQPDIGCVQTGGMISTATLSHTSRLRSESFHTRSATDNTSVTSTRPFRACTREGCDFTTPKTSDWIRHEAERHWPQNLYRCVHCPSGGQPVRRIIDDHPLDLPGGKYFGRKDRLIEHLRGGVEKNGHSLCGYIVEETATSGEIPFDQFPWPRLCGFCSHYFASWEERTRHIPNHFDKGWKISDWKFPGSKSKDHRPQYFNYHHPGDDSDGDDDDNSPSGGGPSSPRFDSGNPSQPPHNQSTAILGIGAYFEAQNNNQLADGMHTPDVGSLSPCHETSTPALNWYRKNTEEPNPVISYVVDLPCREPPADAPAGLALKSRQECSINTSTRSVTGQTQEDNHWPSAVSSVEGFTVDNETHTPTDIPEDLSRYLSSKPLPNCGSLPELPGPNATSIIDLPPQTSEARSLARKRHEAGQALTLWSSINRTPPGSAFKTLDHSAMYLTYDLINGIGSGKGVVWLQCLSPELLCELSNPAPRPLKSLSKFSRGVTVTKWVIGNEVAEHIPLLILDPSHPRPYEAWKDARWTPLWVGYYSRHEAVCAIENLMNRNTGTRLQGRCIGFHSQISKPPLGVEPRPSEESGSDSCLARSSLTTASQTHDEKYHMSLILRRGYGSHGRNAIPAQDVKALPSTELKHPAGVPTVYEKIGRCKKGMSIKARVRSVKTIDSTTSATESKPDTLRFPLGNRLLRKLQNWMSKSHSSYKRRGLQVHPPRWNPTVLQTSRR